MKTFRTVAFIAGFAALTVLGACRNTSSNGDPAMAHVELDLVASNTTIVVGETVTFTARPKDTYGRNAEVTWANTAGRISTEQSGRIARVKFDEVGTYSVSAILSVDGRETRRETREIRVRPLN